MKVKLRYPAATMISSFLVLLVATVSGEDRSDAMSGYEYTTEAHEKVVVCYWGTWANYRNGAGKFTPESIDPSLCTHLIYSFAGLDSATSTIKSLDPWMDLEDDYGLAGFRKATDLKYSNPHLKVTLAIGGWNEGSKKYSAMAKDPIKRKKFVESAVQFLEKHSFDGLDLDWEYPAKRGGIPEDKNNFIALCRDLKSAFEKKNLLLTAAIGASASTIDAAYDVPLMYKYLDYVHIMAYDYHGKWDGKTGHNAPLSSRPEEKGQELFLNLEYTVNYLMKKGAIPEKTVLGVPFYGRAFMLKNPHDNRIGAKVRSTSFQGPFTREDGFLGYNEICTELANDQNGNDDDIWTVEWEPNYQAPYMYKGLKWVSYDDGESIRVKSRYAYDQKLAGVMIWSIDTDDFRGDCGGPKFPMLRTINNALYRAEQGLAAGTTRQSASLVIGFFVSLMALLL